MYISFPLDALRTFNLASICLCREVFRSVLACTRSKARRTFPFLPALTQRRGGLFCSRLHSLKGEEGFFCSRLHSLKGEEGFFCSRSKARRTSSAASRRMRALRSLIITGASDRRKTMRSFKLSTIAAGRRKTMGTLKLSTDSANRRKTMGTLKTFN